MCAPTSEANGRIWLIFPISSRLPLSLTPGVPTLCILYSRERRERESRGEDKWIWGDIEQGYSYSSMKKHLPSTIEVYSKLVAAKPLLSLRDTDYPTCVLKSKYTLHAGTYIYMVRKGVESVISGGAIRVSVFSQEMDYPTTHVGLHAMNTPYIGTDTRNTRRRPLTWTAKRGIYPLTLFTLLDRALY